jgi:hypothetical protein
MVWTKVGEKWHVQCEGCHNTIRFPWAPGCIAVTCYHCYHLSQRSTGSEWLRCGKCLRLEKGWWGCYSHDFLCDVCQKMGAPALADSNQTATSSAGAGRE